VLLAVLWSAGDLAIRRWVRAPGPTTSPAILRPGT
jgi:hypothetical protein